MIIAIIKHNSPTPSSLTPMTKRNATQPNDNDRINDDNDNETLTEAKASEKKGMEDLTRQQRYSHGLNFMHPMGNSTPPSITKQKGWCLRQQSQSYGLKYIHSVGTSTPHPIPKTPTPTELSSSSSSSITNIATANDKAMLQ